MLLELVDTFPVPLGGCTTGTRAFLPSACRSLPDERRTSHPETLRPGTEDVAATLAAPSQQGTRPRERPVIQGAGRAAAPDQAGAHDEEVCTNLVTRTRPRTHRCARHTTTCPWGAAASAYLHAAPTGGARSSS